MRKTKKSETEIEQKQKKRERQTNKQQKRGQWDTYKHTGRDNIKRRGRIGVGGPLAHLINHPQPGYRYRGSAVYHSNWSTSTSFTNSIVILCLMKVLKTTINSIPDLFLFKIAHDMWGGGWAGQHPSSLVKSTAVLIRRRMRKPWIINKEDQTRSNSGQPQNIWDKVAGSILHPSHRGSMCGYIFVRAVLQ